MYRYAEEVILQGKGKLRSLDRHLAAIKKGSTVVIGLTALDGQNAQLRRAGFSKALVLGERVLPAGLGPTSRFNAHGGEIVHKDKPMETVYRQIVWTWEQWRGRETETCSRIVDVPYERYPRTPIPPPALELSLARDPADDLVVVSDPIAYTDENAADILHRINLMRELFGEAAVLTEDLDHFLVAEFKRLNWELLPPGEMPWEQLSQRLEPLLRRFGDRERPVAEHRLKVLTEDHAPDLTAVGRAGFEGYLVFGYASKDLYVLESLHYGNATYVFGEDWETLSQLTKREILSHSLHVARIIHVEGWDSEIAGLLG